MTFPKKEFHAKTPRSKEEQNAKKKKKKKSLANFEPARRAGRSRLSLARCVFANPRNQSLPFTLNPDKSQPFILFFNGMMVL
jgi:hypothetical protein